MRSPAGKPDAGDAPAVAPGGRWPMRLAAAAYALWLAYLVALAVCHRFG